METKLQHEYIDIVTVGGHHFFGGSQLLFDGMIKKCGCSLIAAADVILYLQGCRKPISVEGYKCFVRKLAPAFPCIPYRGIPGVILSLYLNAYFRLRKLPLRAHFGGLGLLAFFYKFNTVSSFETAKVTCNSYADTAKTNNYVNKSCSKENLKCRKIISASLTQDTPLILSIGPGLHQILKPKKERGITLYQHNKTGALAPVQKVRSHFVVITAIDGDILTVSSWGAKYYISLTELCRYARLDLFGLFTNVITLKAG